MVRQVKYRAWLKREKLMVQVDELRFFPDYREDTEDEDLKLTNIWFTKPGALTRNMRRLDEVELLEFTGEKDVEKADLYESHIVEFRDNQIHGGTHAKVIWYEERSGFVFEFIDGEYKGQLTPIGDDWRTYKIIGSMWENPELLGV